MLILVCGFSATTKAPMNGLPSGPVTVPVIVAAHALEISALDNSALEVSAVVSARDASTLFVATMSPPVRSPIDRFRRKAIARVHPAEEGRRLGGGGRERSGDSICGL